MIETLIKQFILELADSVSSAVRDTILGSLATASFTTASTPPRRGPGRPPKIIAEGTEVEPEEKKAVKKARKKGPIQLCPVPRCQNRAAPVFGMVCSKHKDLPKAQIKKFREARRLKASGEAPKKTTKKTTRKPVKKAVKKAVKKIAEKAAQAD